MAGEEGADERGRECMEHGGQGVGWGSQGALLSGLCLSDWLRVVPAIEMGRTGEQTGL